MHAIEYQMSSPLQAQYTDSFRIHRNQKPKETSHDPISSESTCLHLEINVKIKFKPKKGEPWSEPLGRILNFGEALTSLNDINNIN